VRPEVLTRERSARYPSGQIVQALVIVAISSVLFWIVWVYAIGLRDPRYLDGWLLACGMGLQLFFHVAIKTRRLSPKSAKRWRKIHIFVGYLLVGAFISHTSFSLPDTGFEWVLWASFQLVILSGLCGTYLAWSLRAKARIDEKIAYDSIPALRADLARDIHATVTETDPGAAAIALPGLPHHDWIMELYTNHLRSFFQGQRNLTAHLIGSQRPLKQLIHEIDSLSRYVDHESQQKLAAIKNLVVQKDELDFARVSLGLTKAWLFVHVPVTYTLVVLTILHVIVVYAFSLGAW
jgi:hypothetical protein